MSTVLSPSPRSLGTAANAAERHNEPGVDGARSLAALLLAAAVAALVVLADQLIDTWADGHLFLGWVALWVVIFAGSVLFAGSARRLARRAVVALDDWSRSLAEARAETRLWEMARLDPRLKADLIKARTLAQTQMETQAPAVADVQPAALVAPAQPAPDVYVSPLAARRLAQAAMRRRAGYLPYL